MRQVLTLRLKPIIHSPWTCNNGNCRCRTGNQAFARDYNEVTQPLLDAIVASFDLPVASLASIIHVSGDSPCLLSPAVVGGCGEGSA